ncbi:MFS transporter [Micromonospora echinofusca]|uniref:MFS transporter n=1 Tax=Micromonospora echinofusca TaxID=47858 RepID=A0ABS3VSN9_MICEH|nr:MFS transporter [Micromonospora echinofusca]MBO4207545.1 MFS transporter [Micromonospora echinofusca]
MSFTTDGPSCSRWSDVWLAAAARGVSTCGDFLAATALALALQSAGAGGLAVSGLLLAATVPLVVLAPLTGRLADRVDSRTLLVGAGVAQAATCAALAYAGHPVLIIGLVTLLACGLAVTQPTLAALVPAMVRTADLPRASALNQTAGTLGALAGPALAGVLVGQFGVRPPLLLDAASYLALVVAGLLLRTRRGGARSSGTAVARPVTVGSDPDPAPTTRSAWRLRHDPLLLGMVAAMAGALAAVMAMTPVEVFFIRETLGSSTTTYGIVTAAWTAGVLPGAWLFARLTHRFADDGALVRAALALLGGCCLMVLAGAAVPHAHLLVPLWLIGGLCNGGDNVFSNVVLARRVPEAARGRAFAALGAAVQGASMIGFLIGGVLLEFFAPRPLIAAAGLAGLLVVLALWVPVSRVVRRERLTRGPAVGAGLATPVPAR